jgi:O-glycosyl hydrolase
MAMLMTSLTVMQAPVANAASTTITVSGSQRFQTMDGFGVSINAHSWKNGELKPALDMLVDQNGSRIFRVVMEMADWEQTNDNADPNSYNWAYYNPIYSGPDFEDVWSTIGYLRGKGIPSSNIILSFMGDGPTWMGGTSVTSAQEDEWVEQVVSAAYYGRAVRGADFGMFSPNNEPDLGRHEGISMSAPQYARVMNKVAVRLDALGLSSMRLVVPETSSSCGGAGEYWQQMSAYPTLMSKVDHASLHNYSGDACNASANIKASAYPAKSVWMTEFSIYDQAQSFLEQNATGLLVWDGYDSVYRHAILNGLGSAPGNDAGNAPALISYNAATGTYTPRKEFYLYTQLFKYVPGGAVRVGASSSNSAVKSLAFQDPASGRITVVGNNTSGSAQTLTITLSSLGTIPAALQYFQTNSSSNMSQGANVAVTAGSASVTVPAGTVFTLTGGASTPADPVPTVAVTSPLAGATVSGTVPVTASATASAGVSGVQFTLDGAKLASEDTSAPFAVSWDTTSSANGTHVIAATVRDAAGRTATSIDTVVTVNNPPTPSTPGAMVPLSPSRLLDTRINGPKLGPGQTRTLQVTGAGGVPPAGVSAVVLNVTVTETTSAGYLTVSPTGTTRPVVSNLNWPAGATIPNAVTVKLGPSGQVDLFQSGPGSAQVVVDVEGYYVGGTVSEPGGFTPLTPTRILDTRSGGGTLAGSEARDLPILGVGGVPASTVSAVVLNVTVTDPTSTGFLTVFPSGTSRPLASNLNWAPGVTIPNLVTVKVGGNGQVTLFQSGPGTAQVVVDVAGYYVGGTATKPGMFVTLAPARILDTRTSAPEGPGGDLSLTIVGKGGIPATGVSAVVINTTVTDTSAPGVLTVYPGTSPLPTASNLNWSGPAATIPNLVTVQTGYNGTITFHNGSGGTTQVVADTAGYYIQ